MKKVFFASLFLMSLYVVVLKTKSSTGKNEDVTNRASKPMLPQAAETRNELISNSQLLFMNIP